MTCKHVGSGCNAPEGECLGLCLSTTYPVGTRLTDRETREVYFVTASSGAFVDYAGDAGHGSARADFLESIFKVEVRNGR